MKIAIRELLYHWEIGLGSVPIENPQVSGDSNGGNLLNRDGGMNGGKVNIKRKPGWTASAPNPTEPDATKRSGKEVMIGLRKKLISFVLLELHIETDGETTQNIIHSAQKKRDQVGKRRGRGEAPYQRFAFLSGTPSLARPGVE